MLDEIVDPSFTTYEEWLAGLQVGDLVIACSSKGRVLHVVTRSLKKYWVVDHDYYYRKDDGTLRTDKRYKVSPVTRQDMYFEMQRQILIWLAQGKKDECPHERYKKLSEVFLLVEETSLTDQLFSKKD